jgi:hypothetical protein
MLNVVSRWKRVASLIFCFGELVRRTATVHLMCCYYFTHTSERGGCLYLFSWTAGASGSSCYFSVQKTLPGDGAATILTAASPYKAGMKWRTVVGGVRRAWFVIAPQPLGVSENGAAVAAGERQIWGAKLVEIGQKQVMQRQAHGRPRTRDFPAAR